jgi:hypothetical protein
VRSPRARRYCARMVRKPSLRVQWILSLSIAAVVVVVLVIVVDHGNQAANTPAPPINKAAVTEENREARILVTQDQTPHVAALTAGSPAVAVAGAVRAYMADQVAHGFIDGPIERASCGAGTGSTPARLVFSCTVVAADVNYPFDAVVAPAAHQITYCKRDLPPVPSMNIPVSSRCT